MKKIHSIFIAVLLCLMTVSPVCAEPSPSELVKGFYAKLEDVMKRGEALGFKGRYAALEPVIGSIYNMPFMTRFAVGPAWKEASEEDQKKLVEAFTSFSVATYASRFKKYDGEKFEIISEKKVNGGGIIVETHLTPKGEEPVTLNYVVRNDEKGTPRIVDVLLDATISELATRRSEFVTVVKRDGFQALVSMLNDKAAKMGS